MVYALLIICGLLAWWSIFQDRHYRRKVADKAKEAYLKGFNEGVKTSKDFDIKSFIDSKYASFKEKR
jgi:hypothetical protein